jgi:hypothetical protein
LLDKTKDGVWGEGPVGWSIIFTPPYSPKQCAIELKWADGKNFVANPRNKRNCETFALAIKAIRRRWYKGPTKCSDLITHCELYMEQLIQEAYDQDSTLMHVDPDNYSKHVSERLAYMKNKPNEATLRRWKEIAGMKQDGSDEDTNDTFFYGDGLEEDGFEGEAGI